MTGSQAKAGQINDSFPAPDLGVGSVLTESLQSLGIPPEAAGGAAGRSIRRLRPAARDIYSKIVEKGGSVETDQEDRIASSLRDNGDEETKSGRRARQAGAANGGVKQRSSERSSR
ncbi:hypothetical protein AXG93_4461s1530 [Marchantia polymorpha subsp. ruderalis]|uniref:Uncharacterized protein n=1 Tax=Marchantia polymorpha subsp. ruderalis TaxID=1480154 RepID=A0A176WSC0_MARPO|nr:hypothetical protein AXG93_4461s1530 [Marchantia polymorpha subsp. ruderalis]